VGAAPHGVPRSHLLLFELSFHRDISHAQYVKLLPFTHTHTHTHTHTQHPKKGVVPVVVVGGIPVPSSDSTFNVNTSQNGHIMCPTRVTSTYKYYSTRGEPEKKKSVLYIWGFSVSPARDSDSGILYR